MIGLLAGLSFQPGLKLSRGAIIALVIGGVLLAASLAFRSGMVTIERMVETARSEAIAARDAHWRAEIEASNAAVREAEASAATRAAQVSTEADLTILGLRAALSTLEKDNARLPNGDRCGLDAGRARLLDTP